MLQELINLPLYGIYGFFNKKDHSIFIGFSHNMVFTLAQKVNSFKSSNNYHNYEFILIESLIDSSLLKIRYEYWQDFYARGGWLLENPYRAIKFKLRIEVLNDVLWPGCSDPRVYVKIVPVRAKGRIVGVFETMSEAEEFVAINYPDSSNIFNIVYSSNKLTKEYLEFKNAR